MNRTSAIGTAALLSAALAIASAPWGLDQPWLNFVFKPLTTLLVIAYAAGRGLGGGTGGPGAAGSAGSAAVRRWVLIGLVLSLGGDVALMWPDKGFLPGLVSFLLAHLAYLAAFTRVQRFAARPSVFVAYGALAALILAALWPGVPAALRIPVVAYVVCLAAMAAQAAVLWRSAAARGGVLAVGGALFLASDALLATNKFAGPLPLASLWVLSTYWLAQWCIASWLAPPRRP